MPAMVERVGNPADSVVDFHAVIERALATYEAQLQLEKVISLKAEEKHEPKRPLSLCWDCARATWRCLCAWPEQRWQGMVTRPGARQDGRRLEIVVECPGFWPG